MEGGKRAGPAPVDAYGQDEDVDEETKEVEGQGHEEYDECEEGESPEGEEGKEEKEEHEEGKVEDHDKESRDSQTSNQYDAEEKYVIKDPRINN